MKEHTNSTDLVSLGFWIYIMSDCVLFAALFAAYAVLHTATFGGPSPRELFNLPFVLIETMLLLTSSFTMGLGLLAAHKRNLFVSLSALAVTLVLGLSFLGLELSEFGRFIVDGHSWQQSAFLSSFFTLVGTHGLHVALGSVWLMTVMAHVVFKGFSVPTMRKLTILSLFWHFLDIVWIFIFTIVYLFGFTL